MTVQQTIEQLQKIEDKTLQIRVWEEETERHIKVICFVEVEDVLPETFVQIYTEY